MSTLESQPRPPSALDRTGRQPRPPGLRPGIARRNLVADAAPVRASPPPVPDFAIRRERLEQLLDRHPGRHVVLVRGPAGAGKTVLVTQWIRAGGRRCVWLSVNPTHNRPGRLLRDLAALAEPILPRAPDLRVTRSPAMGLCDLRAALDTAAHRMGGELTVVVDDVHRLHDPTARQVLSHLVDHPPEATRIVLIARSKPRLGLERARLRGDLTEIRPAELRFQRAEIDALVATWTERRIHPTEVEQASLGWAAGLRLVQLEATANDAPWSGPSETGGIASEYVSEELVEPSSAAMRSFLEVTCWLPLLTASLRAAVTGEDGPCAPVTSAELEDLPIVPIASRPGAFRYPPILSRVLQQRCSRQGPRAVTILLRRAAEACRQAGELLASLRLFLRAGCADEAAEVCAAVAAHDRSALREVDETLQELGDATLDSARWLPWRIRAAVAAGRLDEARRLVERAERTGVSSTPSGPLPDHAAIKGLVIARATVAQHTGDVTALLACADQVLATAEQPGCDAGATDEHQRSACVGAEDRTVWSRSEVAQALAWKIRALTWSGATDRAREALHALDLVVDRPLADAPVDQVLARAWLAWADGDVSRVARLVTAIPSGPVEDRALAAELALLEGAAHRERGHLGRAMPLLGQARTAGIAASHQVMAALAAAELARCHRAAGATMAALELVVSARAQHLDLPDAVAVHLRSTEARVRLDQGDVVGAQALVGDGPAGTDRQLLAARAAMHHAPDQARDLLDSVDARTPRQAVDKLLLAAQLPDAEPADAAAALTQAAAAGSILGLVRTFLDEGPAVCHRLATLPGDVTDRGLGRLAALARQELSQAPMHGPPGPIEPLTPRELAVVHMLPLRMSNREMAAQMYISVNTLKTHIRAIYRKLDVPHRSEAVRRARALQLV